MSKKDCPTCGHSWLDKYGKNECPKCLSPLTGATARRAPGEASTFKCGASDAMEKQWGECPKNEGKPHMFKFGKCSLCGSGEGAAQQAKGVQGECPSGGKHIYKFSKCTKCGQMEGGLAAKAPTAKPREEILPEAGDCPKGGGHTWKFGKCSKCGIGEGKFLQAEKEKQIAARGY